MKNRFLSSFAILVLALSGAWSLSAFGQTTDEGPAPSDQPSAPMEMGQPDYSDSQPMDAQPNEAQPGGPSGEAPAQTDQGVARVSLIHGDVSTQRGDSGDWSAVVLNQPVMTGDKVSTGDGARAELQLDFANVLRLGPNSKANVANLTHQNIQIQLSEGIADFTISKDSEAQPEIDTPNVSIHPSHHDGVFRVEVRPDGDTIVIVRQGEAQISTPQGSTEVQSGEMATVRGDADSAQYKISSAPDRDDWDRWNSDRDHVIRDANSYQHTNRRYTGAQDLDAYGQWQSVPDYGNVWVPNEPDGWVPYRDGNWTYEPYYGWTWVGYEPWGWAPYHYGRWFPYGNAWAWWPGPVYAGYNPFWSPAYVSFFGWGGGFGFGFGYGGWGGFGWLPIGPCDYFHPWWGGYRGRFGVVNVNNIHVNNFHQYGGIAPLHGGTRFSNIANMHNNHVSRALSTVNASQFGAGRVRAVPASRAQLSGARLMAGNLPVVPSRASLSASGRAAAPSTVRNGGSQRFFGSHNNVARPVSFQQQTASLRQTMAQSHVGAVPAGGRFSAGQSSGVRGTAANTNMQRPSAGTLSNRQMNNSQMSNPGNRSTVNQPSSGQNGNRGGFRPFNPPTSGTRSSTMGNSGRPNLGSNTSPRNMGPGNVQSQRGMTQSARANNGGGFRPFTAPSSSTRPSAPSGAGRPNVGSSNMSPRSMESPRSAMPSPPSNNGGGFRPFTPPSRNEVSRGQSNAPAARVNSGGYWNRTAPSSAQPRSNSSSPSNYGRGSSSSRPQLDMRQPIVRPPSYGGSSRGTPNSGGSHGPSYSAPRPAPSYGGSRGPSYSAPRSAPSYGGSRGPSYSAPRSAPNYGGGGRSSAPSGGGHYSGGGGGHSSGGGGGHSSGGGGGHSSGGSHSSSSGHR